MTLRDQPCFEQLADAISAFAAGRPVVEIVNSGNWGDALIHAGQAAFLRDIGVEVHQIPIQKLRRPKPLKSALRRWLRPERAIVTGSGAYRKVYNRPAEFVRAAERYARILVMPSSYPFRPGFDPARTTYWRRDKLESLDGVPEARFCHDMAFYLSPRPRTASRKLGLLFRDDVERGDFELPANNLDISAEGTHKSDVELFFDRVGDYEVIATNRLHVGIAGALMGREVHLFSGSNDKIRSIFESSMRPFYKNVHYHADPPSPEWLTSLSRGSEVDAL